MQPQYLPPQPLYETPIQLYTKPQAAEALAISVRQLEILVSQGELNAVRWGRNVRFTQEELARFIASKST